LAKTNGGYIYFEISGENTYLVDEAQHFSFSDFRKVKDKEIIIFLRNNFFSQNRIF
jgi:hypothetical protein